MFMLKSTHEALTRALRIEKRAAEINASKTIKRWNALVATINAKGGQAFLDRGVLLSSSDLENLIKLCHPDKHGGSQEANQLTAKLLELRK